MTNKRKLKVEFISTTEQMDNKETDALLTQLMVQAVQIGLRVDLDRSTIKKEKDDVKEN